MPGLRHDPGFRGLGFRGFRGLGFNWGFRV